MIERSSFPSGLIIALVSASVALGSLACDSKQRGEQQTPATNDQANAEKTSSDRDEEGLAPPETSDLAEYTSQLDGDGPLHAVIETSEGNIRCDLHEERAPLTVTNFVGLALGKKAWRDPETGEVVQDKPYYDSVTFHRVIPNFMIQAGDRSGQGTEGPGYTIPDEFHPELSHDEAGVLSMANRGEPNSGGAQWFILEMPATHLDERHSVFGQCENLDVIRKISRKPTDPDNRPQTPPVIETIRIVRGAPEKPTAIEVDDQASSETDDSSKPAPDDNEGSKRK